MSQATALSIAKGYDELGFNNFYERVCELFEQGYTPEDAFMLLGIN